MKKEKPETKLCKHCKIEIPYGAKVCPNCRKKQGANGCLIAVAVVLLLGLIGGMSGGKSETKETAAEKIQQVQETGGEGKEVAEATMEETTVEETTSVEYIPVTVTELMEVLNSNAMKAADTYKGQYLEVTGKLSTIDSSGKYISLLGDGDFEIVGVQCYIKNEEQKQAVMDLSVGDTVTLKGKCKEVGEIFGYSLDIDSIGK